ncbi:MAG TPA: glycoside hydrolase family 5 protein [Polyangiaceae bacterium]
MRTSRNLLLVTLLMLAAAPSCDPGTSHPIPSPTPMGTGGTATSAPINELFLLSPEPPGEVDMTPPLPGQLNVFEQNRALGRGINIGNCLDAPAEGSWGVTLHQYMFEVIARSGFDSIRLPIKWSNHAKATAPYEISTGFFERVDWAIAHALTRGLKIIIDIHHFGNTGEDGIYNLPEANHDKFVSLWRQIAEHYQNYPKELYFEVLNEPRDKLEPLWNQYLAEAVQVIRESNPGRTLVAGGIWWNKWDALSRVTFPDDNIIATFHYYNPYCFTLQDGQTWEKACQRPNGDTKALSGGEASWPVIFPKVDPNPDATEKAQRDKLEQDLAAAAAWSASAKRPLYMGEFGVSQLSNAAARADYVASLARAAERNGITWAYWEFSSGMGAWNGAKMAWDPAMLDALMPKNEPSNTFGAAGAAGAPNAATTTLAGSNSGGNGGAAAGANASALEPRGNAGTTNNGGSAGF